MITFLSSPKPFTGLDEQNQLNAIKSWKHSVPGARVILYGKAEGINEVACELDVAIHEDVECNEFGTPLFNDIVLHAERHSDHDIFVYINADIVVCQSLASAIESIHLQQFLMVGQRLDLALDFTLPNDVEQLDGMIEELESKGLVSLHPAKGSDYFVFRRGTWNPAPAVAIGRAAYDNVLIWDCLRRKVPVIDATLSVRVFHQFHKYDHVSGGKSEVFYGEEANRHRALLPRGFRGWPESANFRLESNRMVRNFARGRLFRYVHLLLRQHSNITVIRYVGYIYLRFIILFGLDAPREYSIREVLRSAQS